MALIPEAIEAIEARVAQLNDFVFMRFGRKISDAHKSEDLIEHL